MMRSTRRPRPWQELEPIAEPVDASSRSTPPDPAAAVPRRRPAPTIETALSFHRATGRKVGEIDPEKTFSHL